MGVSTYFLILCLIYYSVGEDCVLQRPSEPVLEKKLHDELLCNYRDTDQPYTNNTNGVEVQVSYIVKGFHFDSEEESFTVYSWNMFEWIDNRFKWDVDKYKGIRNVYFEIYDIWSPNLKLQNKVHDEWFFNIGECMVNATGKVKCAPAMEHTIVCNSVMRDWPYDKRRCTFQFDDESWTQMNSNITFNKVHLLFMEDAIGNSGWNLISEKVTKNLTGDYQFTIEFVLERVAEGLEVTIVIPSVIISVLTVTAIFLNVKDDVRIGMLCFSILSHFMFCNEISENVSKYGADTPVILLFVSRSTVLTLLIIFVTFLLRFLSKLTTSPPRIITFFNTVAFNNLSKYFIVPRWNVEVLDKSVLDSLSQTTEWIDFSNILNSITLFISVITYIILFSLYMPKYTPRGPFPDVVN